MNIYKNGKIVRWDICQCLLCHFVGTPQEQAKHGCTKPIHPRKPSLKQGIKKTLNTRMKSSHKGHGTV